MKTKIPYLNHGPEYDALVDTIDYAAERANLSSERFYIALTYWLERVADNMGAGRVVPLPGFGKFGPWLEERPAKQARHNGGHPYCIPVFVPGRPLREQIKTTAPCSRAAKERLQRARHNASRTSPTMARSHSEQERIRRLITKAFGGDVQ